MTTPRRRFVQGAAAASATLLAAPRAVGQARRSLLFWHFYTQPARATYLRRMADQYEQANPGLAITIESMPNPVVISRLAAAKAAGVMPDVLIHNADTAIPLFAAGDLLPADDIVKDLGGPDYFAFDLLKRMSQYQGHYLNLPHYTGGRILVYRKDRLAAAGLSPPVTWDDALKAAVATTQGPDHYGWIFQLSRADNGGCSILYPLSRTAGASWITAKGDVTFDTPAMRDTVAFVAEVTRKAGGPGVFNYNVNENFNLVNSGKTSMTLDVSALVAVAATDAPQVADQLDAVLVPQKSQPGTNLQGGAIMILKGRNNNPADASGFARFLLEPKRHLEFLHTIPLFMMPTTKGTNTDAFFDEPTIRRFRHVTDVSLEALKSATLFCSDDGINPFASLILNSRLIEDMLARIVLNDMPVVDAVKDTHAKLVDLTGTFKRRLRL